ncbi:centromere protein O isoform X2 [Struthio camelus]|uniref:centromere protein O isoform X2 n=1 Tax=Struthio camelus TaxID=8801 RepID=UPI003603BF2D
MAPPSASHYPAGLSLCGAYLGARPLLWASWSPVPTAQGKERSCGAELLLPLRCYILGQCLAKEGFPWLISAFPLARERQRKMEERRAYSQHGVLSHLETLEARAHELALKQEETEQQEEKLARLKARVQELRLQRDELRAKVDLQQKRLLGKEGVMTSGVPDAAQPSDRAVLEWKIKTVQAMLQVFYLTGISGKLTKRGVCFCVSTAYEGTYLDSYYVDLIIKPAVQIHRHSVPVFIPLEQLAKKYLQTDIKRFLSVLSDHLNAYVGRRYQADQLQRMLPRLYQRRQQLTRTCFAAWLCTKPLTRSAALKKAWIKHRERVQLSPIMHIS